MEQIWLIVRVQRSLTSFKGSCNLLWYTSCVSFCISYHCWAVCCCCCLGFFWRMSSFLCSYSNFPIKIDNKTIPCTLHFIVCFSYSIFFLKGIMLYCIFVLMTTVPTGKIGFEWTHCHCSLKVKFQCFSKKIK